MVYVGLEEYYEDYTKAHRIGSAVYVNGILLTSNHLFPYHATYDARYKGVGGWVLLVDCIA